MKPFRFSLRFLATLLFLLSLPAASHGADRPNIVVIMADDLGFSDIGCYGSEIRTPNLDKLADDGLRFTQFYNTAKCHSSRVSLLTGLYCGQAGNQNLTFGATIADVLGKAGYFTAMSGKWHLSDQPTDFGFDRYWGHLSGSTNFFLGNDSFRYNGEAWKIPKRLNGRRFYTTHAITDFALEFLDEATATDKPFLLYTAFNAPHYPLQAPEEDIKKYDGVYDTGWDELRQARYKRQIESGLFPSTWKLSPRPDHIPAWDSLTKEDQKWESSRMEVFAAMVEILDTSVGRIVSYLKKKNLLDNTLILFCSDNGACPFERTKGREINPWEDGSYWTYDASWAWVGNTPFRLYKQNQHEGGISSPMIAHWPEGLKTEAGAISNQPAHIIDFMATLVDVTEAEYPEQVGARTIAALQGKSLVPIFSGETREIHNPLFLHFGTDRALREGPWKLVSAKLGRWELYNLDEDRTELNDLSSKYPERVEAMAAKWFDIGENVNNLNAGKLQPVKDSLTKISFRKDTTPGAESQKSSKNSRKRKNKK